MRLSCLMCCVFAAGSTLCGASEPAAESEPVAYNQHRDLRFGHEHTYPDRGAILRDVPKGAITVSYAGLPYRFHDGVWFEPRGPAFMVVAPPIGVIVPELPTFSTVLARSGQTYVYCNDVYYKPRPDVGGYEVINDPTDQKPEGPGAAPSAAAAPAMSAAAPAAGVAPGTPLDVSAAEVGQPSATPVAIHESAAPAAAATAAGGVASATTPTAAASGSVVPLAAAVPVTTPAGAPNKVFVYPKNGQSADQQARDRYDCYRFAVAQSGFDPMRSAAIAAASSGSQADYDRAQGACLDARGYTVR